MKRTPRHVLFLPFLILAALAITASPAAAGAGVWTSLGPDGARVTALAVDPLDAGVVYAGTQGSGVFKSTDGGESWAFTGRGLGNSFILAVAADPVHRGTVYAATSNRGLVQSTDGGATWVRIWDGARPDSPGELTTIYSLVLDPRRPGSLYAGTGAGVYRSTDGGATWRLCGNLSEAIPALALDSAGGWLFAGRTRVYKSGDQGATWVAVSSGIPANAVIESLAIDPDSPRTLLAATTLGIYRSLDRGRSWHPATGSPARQITVVVFQRGGRAYASIPQVGLFRSADAGATWQRSLVALPDAYFRAIAAGPGVVYTGDVNDPALRGLVRSLDGGATWEASMRGLSGLAVRPVALDPSNPRTLYAGGTALFKSTDRGMSWTRLDPGVPPLPRSAILDILIDPAQPARIYVTTNGAVPFLRSDDGGATWVRLNGATVPVFLLDLTADPRAPGAIWGTGTGDLGNGLFHSGDGGETWERVEGLPVDDDFFALHVEVDPRDPRVIYLGAAQNAGDPLQTEPRLFRSADGGETWERRDTGLADGAVGDIALDTADPSTLYASTSGVYRSTDAGASWSLLPARGRFFTSLATAPAGPGRPAALYATRWDIVTPTAVMCSTDRGETWTALRPGLDTYIPGLVEVDPTDPRRLYLGTVERGLMTYNLE